jgi:hypothetical protein
MLSPARNDAFVDRGELPAGLSMHSFDCANFNGGIARTRIQRPA